MAVNLAGPFFGPTSWPDHERSKQKVVPFCLMSSVTGHQAHQNLTAYGMSKAALEMLAKVWSSELSPYHINVNAIAPGQLPPNAPSKIPGMSRTWSKITPMGRPATVGDIAATALFLVSDQARHITGQTLMSMGGWTSVSPSPYNLGHE